MDISASDKLLEQHATWRRKAVLRGIYEDYFRQMAAACTPGRSLEIGAGSGGFKQFADDVVATDLISLPWLDVVADAQQLPLADSSFSNIVALDVLHHIERPVRFMREAQRILKPGGRLVLVEPAITPLAGPFYQHLHPEPVDMNVQSMADGPLTLGRDAFEGNQAIMTLMLKHDAEAVASAIPDMQLTVARHLSLLAYPLSGGFRPWQALPTAWVPAVLKLEQLAMPVFGRLAAFRWFVVWEKQG